MKVWQYIPDNDIYNKDWFYKFKIFTEEEVTELRTNPWSGKVYVMKDPSHCVTEKVIYELLD